MSSKVSEQKNVKQTVLIVDADPVWVEQGEALLKKGGYKVNGFEVFDPEQFISKSLPIWIDLAIKDTVDILLIGKDLGKGITSTRLICLIRHNYPELPIIRWQSGNDPNPHMDLLGVSTVEKPTRNIESEFADAFDEALAEQRRRLSGPMGIFGLEETMEIDPKEAKTRAELRVVQLRKLGEIALLADKDTVNNSFSDRYVWNFNGQDGEITRHEIGQFISSGVLTADDLRPFLPALQKVIEKFESTCRIEVQLKLCFEPIKSGKLGELELYRNCASVKV